MAHIALSQTWKIATSSGATLVMPNRLVMAPMTRRQATPAAEPVEAHAKYYSSRARGGAGLIITEGTHVNNTNAVDADCTPQCATPTQIEGWKRVADAVHQAGSKIAMQLWHTGLLSRQPVAPSVPAKHPGPKPPTALDEKAIDNIAEDFASSAKSAIHEAGFDAVEVHGAHGYLLDSFVSPLWNERQDSFGTDRFAFPALVVRRIRGAIGADVPIIYRFSQWTVMDYTEVKFRDSTELAAFLSRLSEAGVNCFHVSTRTVTAPGFPAEHPTRTLAGWTRMLSGLPVIAVGGVGVSREFMRGGQKGETFQNVDPTPALQLVASGEVDALAIGRAFLTDKTYCSKLLQGRWEEGLPYQPDQVGPLDW